MIKIVMIEEMKEEEEMSEKDDEGEGRSRKGSEEDAGKMKVKMMTGL